MYVIFLIVVTTGLVSTAAYFSVVGIASMFAYNYVPAMIMGITLEAGKIGVAVYLYRYWRLISRLFKSVLITFLALLMFITSVGIFGFLSQGYQKTSEEYKLISLELSNLEQEQAAKKAREQEINRQVGQLPADSVTNKIRLAREFSDEQTEIRDRLAVIEPQIQSLHMKRLSFETKIGPISYVARMLDLPQDIVVFYAILLLVFVADPLAVTMTVGCNMVLLRFWEFERRRSEANTRRAAPSLLETLLARAHAMAVRSNIGAPGQPVQMVRRKGVMPKARSGATPALAARVRSLRTRSR